MNRSPHAKLSDTSNVSDTFRRHKKYAPETPYIDQLFLLCVSLLVLELPRAGLAQGASWLVQADTSMFQAQALDEQGDFQAALTRLDQARKLYQAGGSISGQANAWASMGRVYAQGGQYIQAFAALEQSRSLCAEISDEPQKAQVLLQLGMLYAQAGEAIKALETFQAALLIQQRVGSRLEQGRILNNIGGVYKSQAWYAEAHQAFTQALDFARASGDAAGETTALLNRALTFAAQQEQLEAVRLLQEVLTRPYLQTVPLLQATVCLHLGDLYVATGASEPAANDAYQRALTIFRNLHHSAGEACALQKLGGLQVTNGQPTAALPLLVNALALSRVNRDAAGELEILTSLAEVYHALDDPAKQAAALTEMGAAALRLSDYAAAEKALKQALLLYQYSVNDPAGKLQALTLRGQTAILAANYDRAVTYLAQAFSLAETIGSAAQQAALRTARGEAYFLQGDFPAAVDMLQQAALQHDALHQQPELAHTLLLLGETYLQQTEYDAASAALQRAFALQTTENESEIARTLAGLGECYLQQQAYPLALQTFQHALNGYQAQFNRVAEGQMFARLAAVYLAQNQTAAALSADQHALAIAREVHDPLAEQNVLQHILSIQQQQGAVVPQTLCELGQVAFAQAEFDVALTHFAAALTLATQAGDQAATAAALLGLGQTYAQQGQLEEARDYLENEALSAYRALQNPAGEAAVWLQIGHFYFAQAEYDLARQAYHAALALFQELEDYAGQGIVFTKLGDILTAQGQHAEATASYRQAVLLFGRVDDRYQLLTALLKLGDAYAQQGLNWDALETYKRALGILHDTGAFMYGESAMRLRVASFLDHQTSAAQVQRRIARQQNQLGQPEQALATLADARDVQQAQNDVVGEAETLGEMAAIEREIGHPDEAVERLTEKLALEQQQDDYAAQEETVKQLETLLSAPDVSVIVPPVRRVGSVVQHDAPAAPIEASAPVSTPPIARVSAPPRQTLTAMNGVTIAAPRAFVNPLEAPPSQAWPSADADETRPLADLPLLPGVTELHAPTAPSSARSDDAIRQQQAERWNMMGIVYLRQGEFQKAGRAFLNAKQLQHAAADVAGLAFTLNNQGLLYVLLHQEDEAEHAFQAALTAMRQAHDLTGEATVLNHLALLLYRQGVAQEAARHDEPAGAAYRAAMRLFKQAAAITERQSEQATTGTIWNNAGLASAQLAGIYRRLSARVVDPRMQIAYLHQAAQAFYEARQRYADALLMTQTVGGKAGESATRHNVGKLYARFAHDDTALRFWQQALTLERRAANRLDEARTLSEIAYLYEQQGRRQLEHAQASLMNPSTGWRTWLSALGEFGSGGVKLQQALTLYQQALDRHEQFRAAARIEEFKLSLAAETVDVYQQSVLLLLTLRRPVEAFNMAERARSRALLDQLANVRIDPQDSATGELTTRAVALQTTLTQLDQQQAAARKSLLNFDEQKAKQIQHAIDATQEAYQQVIIELKLSNPAYAALISMTPLRLDEVQKRLPTATTLVSYFVTPAESLAFVVSPQELHVVPLPIREADLRHSIEALRRKPADRQAALASEFSALYDGLIAPVKPYLNTAAVILAPHGVLHYLPFAALSDGAQFFGAQFTLTMLPSASVLAVLPQPRALQDGTALVVGHNGFPPFTLTYAEEEARQIAERGGTTAMLHEAATIRNFLAAAPQASQIHFAGHAELDAQQPYFSGLRLHDGMLPLSELYRLHLARASLVVLSACNTQIGQASRGDDWIALNRAFLYAGASSVIASLWSVDDGATRELMLAFYQAIAQGKHYAAALQHAQQKTRARYPHPYYWAAFAFTGS